MSEPPHTDLLALTASILRELGDPFNGRFAFFGHSMGAMIAFELSRLLARDRRPLPAHLLLSACSAPPLIETHEVTYNLPEPEFLEELKSLKGTPPEALAHAELMQIMIPLLRADFQVCQTYRYRPGPPLSCPITVYGGVEDDYAPPEHLTPWAEQTTGAFRVKLLAGDHFFLHTSEARLLEALTDELSLRADATPATTSA